MQELETVALIIRKDFFQGFVTALLGLLELLERWRDTPMDYNTLTCFFRVLLYYRFVCGCGTIVAVAVILKLFNVHRELLELSKLLLLCKRWHRERRTICCWLHDWNTNCFFHADNIKVTLSFRTTSRRLSRFL